jgi:CheY-like chemotaxis protein
VNILIVDDEIDQLQSLRRGLKNRGYLVYEAQGSEEALIILEQNVGMIDLVLTDHYMPGMTGVELVGEIRSRFGWLPVIVMSAHASKGLALQIAESASDGFIGKPFTLNQLIAEVEKVASGKGKDLLKDAAGKGC